MIKTPMPEPAASLDPAPPLAGTGVLPAQRIRALVRDGAVAAPRPVEDAQIQPASLDLRLGARAWRIRASFLPGRGGTVAEKLSRLAEHELDLAEGRVLERGAVYVVSLQESLALPREISAKANPKSTTGRLDLFTRLLYDGAREFEAIPAGYRGPLYLEVAPLHFSVRVREGLKLNQLRFFRGSAEAGDEHVAALESRDVLVYDEHGREAKADIARGVRVRADLTAPEGSAVVGWRAKRDAPPLDMEKVRYYDPAEFWDPIPPPPDRTLLLTPGDFYILVSKERVRVPPDWAAEMVAFDPSFGEFRVHYAGFFDPGFGFGARGEIKGTRAVLEVRSRDVPFLLEDGQIVGRLLYERLLDRAEIVYGPAIGSSYQSQGVALSKQFR